MMSKFSLDVLQRCVFPFTTTDDPDVILGAAFGEDVALIRVGGDILASHLDPIVGAIDPRPRSPGAPGERSLGLG